MCNEYRLPTDFSAIFDRFAEIKVPFRLAEEPAADLKRHVFPKYQTVALRPVDPADPWAGFEGLTMTWGVPMMVSDPKKGEPVLRQPNNCRDDNIEGRGWKDAYLNRLGSSLVLPKDLDDLLPAKSRSLHVRPLKGRPLAPTRGISRGRSETNYPSAATSEPLMDHPQGTPSPAAQNVSGRADFQRRTPFVVKRWPNVGASCGGPRCSSGRS